ncbi:MAG: hypothetical protein E7479_08750 [Ruminococcaceae bacterium]|nr:hypothetical protein [Oscillospiraceae bacterium]
MAEHDEINFEQELREKFQKLDGEIKIPEIPDVKDIFEKAEEKKTNAVPFKKYSRYVAAAAAVVLICVGIPVVKAFSEVSLDRAPESANLLSDVFDIDGKTFDYAKSEETEVVIENEQEEPEAKPGNESEHKDNSSTESSSVAGNGILDEDSVKWVLANYFTTNKEKGKKPESSSTHRPIDGKDDIRTIKKEIDENRSILVTLENEKISVKLFDVFGKDEAAEDTVLEEVIVSEFWVEGIFEGSYLSGGYYIINLVKPVAPEELEEENYLPKFGTGEEENTIPEESVFISEEVTEGIISLIVEINVATGEYKIYASLV